MKEESHVCVYCGAPAVYQFKNGNWCCSKNRQSCPTYRTKITKTLIARHKEVKEKYGSSRFSKTRPIVTNVKYPSRGEHVCVYCGGYAEYQLKDGRWCCQKKKNWCPEIRKKNSEGCKRSYKNGRIGKGFSKGSSKSSWNKGLSKETDERVAKQSNTLKRLYSEGKIKPHIPLNCSHPHTEETKQKFRALRLKEIEDRGIVIYTPNFSVKACSYMDKLNESKGWHLQHGLNGGEVRVDSYFLDGYDKELNIAFEYDERKHYKNVNQNLLKERDIFRMNYIHKKLNCRFFRYNEERDTLYEVHF